MISKREQGLVIQVSVLAVLIVIIVILIILLVYFIYVPPTQNEENNKEEKRIGDWEIFIDGNETKIIYAETQADGSAKWSGEFEIKVYDQNGTPLKDVKILLNGCGITQGGVTGDNGTVHLSLRNVILPSGTSEDEIVVQISYEKTNPPQLMQDSISVLRKY